MDARANNNTAATATTTTTTTSSTTRSTSDEETSYATISSAPPKRRAGRTKFRETRHPTFKGVRRRNSDRWVCEVREPNKKSRIWLGTFPTAEMAARAHDVAAIALRGRSACLNFADSAWLLPVPESKSPGDIKRAAAMAAEAFRPQVDADGPGMNPTARDGWTNDRQGGDAVGEGGNEFLFGDEMQGYFDMAQGMLIDPPPPLMSEDVVEEGEGDGESMSLWGYSF